MNCTVPPIEKIKLVVVVVGGSDMALVNSFFRVVFVMNQFDVKSNLQSSRVESGMQVAVTSPSWWQPWLRLHEELPENDLQRSYFWSCSIGAKTHVPAVTCFFICNLPRAGEVSHDYDHGEVTLTLKTTHSGTAHRVAPALIQHVLGKAEELGVAQKRKLANKVAQWI